MRKIAHVRELTGVSDLPVEVVDVIRDAVTILDGEYGENRDVDSGYGGYVLVIDNKGDLGRLQELNIDVDTVIPEYVDFIRCDSGEMFTGSLLLIGSDFGVVVIVPQELLSDNLRKYVLDK